MAKKWTPQERQAFAQKMQAARAAKNPQTKTPKEAPVSENISSANPGPEAANPTQAGVISFTPEQFNRMLDRLGGSTDKTPAPSMSGLQVNPFGAVVGTVTKFNVDPNYYPNPVEDLLEDFDVDPRMRRHNLRENYFLTWDMTAKPYPTKDNLMVQEPTFHSTLYGNEFDDEGEATGRAYVIQTLHFNEDEELARMFAAEEGVEVTEEGIKELMDRTRYWRMRNWLVDVFYPPRNFEMNIDAHEEAIGGSVVKVVTKSNVKGFGNPTPKISDEELN